MAAASIAVGTVPGPETTIPTIPLRTEQESVDAVSSPEFHSAQLITSPYTTPEHLLDLSTLNTANRLLAQALTILSPIRPGYATAPYIQSFNWAQVFTRLHELARQENHLWSKQSFYVVAFRSVLKPTADPERLHLLDERSHAEAVQSGGLLKYWFGVKNERRENLATCMF
ncbi:hypothetical protein BDV18DRAFT_132514 [Aspergillus unguis]